MGSDRWRPEWGFGRGGDGVMEELRAQGLAHAAVLISFFSRHVNEWLELWRRLLCGSV